LKLLSFHDYINSESDKQLWNGDYKGNESKAAQVTPCPPQNTYQVRWD